MEEKKVPLTPMPELLERITQGTVQVHDQIAILNSVSVELEAMMSRLTATHKMIELMKVDLSVKLTGQPFQPQTPVSEGDHLYVDEVKDPDPDQQPVPEVPAAPAIEPPTAMDAEPVERPRPASMVRASANEYLNWHATAASIISPASWPNARGVVTAGRYQEELLPGSAEFTQRIANWPTGFYSAGNVFYLRLKTIGLLWMDVIDRGENLHQAPMDYIINLANGKTIAYRAIETADELEAITGDIVEELKAYRTELLSH